MTAADAGVAPEQATVAAVLAEAERQALDQAVYDDLLGVDPKEHVFAAVEVIVRTHVAAALAANLPADDGARTAIKAEALREAADDFAVIPHPYEGGVTAWLRDRADNRAADQHTDEAQR